MFDGCDDGDGGDGGDDDGDAGFLLLRSTLTLLPHECSELTEDIPDSATRFRRCCWCCRG